MVLWFLHWKEKTSLDKQLGFFFYLNKFVMSNFFITQKVPSLKL